MHLCATHDVPQRTFRRLIQALVRLPNLNDISEDIADNVLHSHFYFDDVFVFGQHL